MPAGNFSDTEPAAFVRGKDSPPVGAFFMISAFCCDTGLMTFAIRSLVDFWVRLRHGANSATARKIELTCRVRRINTLLMESNKPGSDNLQQAQTMLQEAMDLFPPELQAPLYSLEGKRLLFHQHPPAPWEALAAYEKACSLLPNSPYCANMAQPHHLLFGAAMAAVICKKASTARQYYERYQAFIAKFPKRSWGADVEQDLEKRLQALEK